MDNVSKATGCGCIVQILMVAVYVFISALSVNWLLIFFLQKSIPLWAAAVIGLIGGSVTVPASIVIYLLHAFGVM